MNEITELIMIMANHSIFKLVSLWIVFDTILGMMAAFKQKKLNSSLGIDGCIRKISMLACLCFLALSDSVMKINIITLMPAEIKNIININYLGLVEFFGMMFYLYESISILKNMYRLNIPMPEWLYQKLENLLKNLTKEVKENE